MHQIAKSRVYNKKTCFFIDFNRFFMYNIIMLILLQIINAIVFVKHRKADIYEL